MPENMKTASTKTKEEDKAKLANPVNDSLGVPTDFSNWQEESTGFAPYWSPDEEGRGGFVARLVDKDTNATDFVRYMLQAGQDLECWRGPAEDAEQVTVKKGEFFTISVYFSLMDIFDFYLENKFVPWMKIEARGKTKTRTPSRSVIQWKLLIAPSDKKRANELRAERTAKTLAARNTPQLEEGENDGGDN